MKYSLKPYRDSWFFKSMAKATPPRWMAAWNTIYYPDMVENPHDSQYADVVEHELVHLHQQRRYTFPLYWLLYKTSQYFRWKFEREAFVVQLKYGYSIAYLVGLLKKHYKLSRIPEAKMVQWFKDAYKAEFALFYRTIEEEHIIYAAAERTASRTKR